MAGPYKYAFNPQNHSTRKAVIIYTHFIDEARLRNMSSQ